MLYFMNWNLEEDFKFGWCEWDFNVGSEYLNYVVGVRSLEI